MGFFLELIVAIGLRYPVSIIVFLGIIVAWTEFSHRRIQSSGFGALWWPMAAVYVVVTLSAAGIMRMGGEWGSFSRALAFAAPLTACPLLAVSLVVVPLQMAPSTRWAFGLLVGALALVVGIPLGIVAFRIASCTPGPCPSL